MPCCIVPLLGHPAPDHAEPVSARGSAVPSNDQDRASSIRSEWTCSRGLRHGAGVGEDVSPGRIPDGSIGW